MYRQVMKRIIKECRERNPGSVSVMAATHNEQSIKHVVEMMREAKISPSSETVSFAQLYGMCDQVDYTNYVSPVLLVINQRNYRDDAICL